MRTRSAGRWVALLCLAAAYSSPAVAQQAPPAHVHPKNHTETLPAPVASGRAPNATPPAAAAPLTLGELELLALERNPTLAQAAAQIDISRARAFQAGLQPNPVVGYEAERTGARGAERRGAFVQQEIVTGGKLRLSRLKYQKEAFAAEVQAHAQRLRVVNGLHVAFYEVLAAQQMLAIKRRALQNAEDARKTTQELLNVGQGNEPDLLQAEIEANRARVAVKRSEAGYRRAWDVLATAVGVPDLPVRPLAGTLEPADTPLRREEALAALLRDSPEIQFAADEVERDWITVERERREPIPNVIVRGGVGYDHETRSRSANVSVGLRIPVWDQNRGTVWQAQADLARAQAEVVRVELSLRRRFTDTYQRYETAQESVKDFREQSLPKAQRAYELYQEYFRTRRATWPQVLVAERTVTQLSEEYVSGLLDLRRAEVEIRGLLLGTGGLTPPPGPTPQGLIEASPRPR